MLNTLVIALAYHYQRLLLTGREPEAPINSIFLRRSALGRRLAGGTRGGRQAFILSFDWLLNADLGERTA